MFALRERIESTVDQRLDDAAKYYALLFDSELRRAVSVAHRAAAVLANRPNMDEAALYELLRDGLQQEPLVYGSAIAFAPEQYPGRRLFSPYVYREGQALAQTDIATTAYDYSDGRWEWYSAPMLNGWPVWTEPYFDEGAGNILMSTDAVPVQVAGRFIAVVTVDIPLQQIGTHLGERFGTLENCVVLSDSGRFIYNSYVPETIGDARSAQDWLIAQGRADLADALRERVTVRGGMLHAPHLADLQNGAGQLLAFAPIVSADRLFIAGMSEHRARLAVVTAEYAGIGLIVVLLALMLVIAWLATGTVTRRTARLQQVAVRLADGDLSARADIASGDEIGRLGAAVDSMAASLHRREREIAEINRGLEHEVRRRTSALERSEAQFKAVVDRLPSGIMLKDADGGILFVNEEERQWLAVASPFEVLGARLGDLFQPDSAAELTEL